MSDLELNIDFDVGIRIAWDGDEQYAEIDAPLEVQRWIEDKLGIRGMSRLDAEVRHYVEQERIENKSMRDKSIQENRSYWATKYADFGAEI